MPVQEIAHPVRTERGRYPRRAVAVDPNARMRHQLAVAAIPSPHQNRGSAARQARRRIAGILDRLPDVGHHQPLLRIHQLRLTGRDAEEQRIKLGNALDETAPFDVGLVGLLEWIAINRLPVPTPFRNLDDAVLFLDEIAPERRHVLRHREAAAHPDHRNADLLWFSNLAGHTLERRRPPPSHLARTRLQRAPGICTPDLRRRRLRSGREFRRKHHAVALHQIAGKIPQCRMLEEDRRHQLEPVKLVELMRQRRETDRIKSVFAQLAVKIQILHLDLDQVRYRLQQRCVHFPEKITRLVNRLIAQGRMIYQLRALRWHRLFVRRPGRTRLRADLPNNPVAFRDNDLLPQCMRIRRGIKDRAKTLLLQNPAPHIRSEARATRKPQGHILGQPPPVQKAEGHMDEQGLADGLIEQQQPVGSQRCFRVAQRAADVPRCMQHVCRDHDIIAARIDALRRDRLLDVKDAATQVRMLRPIDLSRMRQERLRQIRVAVLLDARSMGHQSRQHPCAGAAGPRADLEQSNPRRRLLLQALLDKARHLFRERLVEVIRNRIVLVDALHQRQRAVREHHVRCPHCTTENAGKRAQHCLDQHHLRRHGRIRQPLPPACFPFLPTRPGCRYGRLDRRIPFTVLPEIAASGENAQTLVQPLVVRRSQPKPRLYRCDGRPPA